MPDTPYIAYYRVSTDRQSRSGLGLEAQQRAVRRYLDGHAGDLVAEFVEVESGRKTTNRPQLQAALAECRRQKTRLIIAKLDRLARSQPGYSRRAWFARLKISHRDDDQRHEDCHEHHSPDPVPSLHPRTWEHATLDNHRVPD